MNSSKGWGDDLDSAAAGQDPEFRRGCLRNATAIIVVSALLASLWAGWLWVRRGGEPLLVEARGLIQTALPQDPRTRSVTLKRGEHLLREYLARNGERKDAAELLLCSLLTLRGYGNPNQGIGEPVEIEDLLNKVSPTACSTDDLLTAIDVFRRTGKTSQADWLVGAALITSQGTQDYSGVLRVAAAIRYDLGLEKAVLDHCAELTKIDAADPEPWRVLAMVYEDGGYTEKFIQAVQKVIELARGDVSEYRLKLVDSLIKIGDRRQARDQFALLFDQSPDRLAQHPLVEAKLLMLEGQPSEALSIIKRVLVEHPQDAEAILLRSKLHLSENELDDAIRLQEGLLKSEPMHPEAHYVLGQAYARRGDRERAQDHLEMHRQILDTRVRLHRLERLAGKNPRDVETRLEIVKLYEQLGMADLANFWRRAATSAQQQGNDSGDTP